MTHYDVDYAGLTGDAKVQKALADITAYIGEDRFKTLVLIADRDGEEATRFGLEVMLGVSGYPVEAFVQTFVRKEP